MTEADLIRRALDGYFDAPAPGKVGRDAEAGQLDEALLLRFTPSQRDVLKAEARRLGTNEAAVIRLAVAAYFDKSSGSSDSGSTS